MKIFVFLAILCISISVVLGEISSSKEEAIRSFASEVIERIEQNRDDCPNLPERSGAEEQLSKCTIELEIKANQQGELDSDEKYKSACGLLTRYFECSSSLIDEVISCGKNPELVTIIGIIKGNCEYANRNHKGFKTLQDEILIPCFEEEEVYNSMKQCGKEELENADFEIHSKSFNSFSSVLDLFCPLGKIVRKCITPALERHCPEAFTELSTIYQSSRRLSGDSAAFDKCLASSTSSSTLLRNVRAFEPKPMPLPNGNSGKNQNCYPKCVAVG